MLFITTTLTTIVCLFHFLTTIVIGGDGVNEHLGGEEIALNEKGIVWIWEGSLRSTSIRFKIVLNRNDLQIATIAANPLNEKKSLTFSRLSGNGAKLKPISLFNNTVTYYVGDAYLEGLKPNTSYEWHSVDEAYKGGFTTPVSPLQAFNFTFEFASCADNGSNHVTFSLIEALKPLFFIHMGDLHYGNINANSLDSFFLMYNTTLAQSRQASLYRNVPLVYMWDDHDFGPNNADYYSLSREAAKLAYKTFVPSYLMDGEFPNHPQQEQAIHQKFEIGRVLFILTDTSSERKSDLKPPTTLGESQLVWLEAVFDSLAKPSSPHAMAFWITTMPWIDDYYKWGEFKQERERLGVKLERIKHKLIILSGDAHQVAVDDGSHSVGSVVVFHAAAIDAKPTTKGGPYSHGVFPGRNQFGKIQVVDYGNETVCVVFTAFRVNPQQHNQLRVLIEYDTCNPTRTRANLYVPSPLIIQKLWKYLKNEFLEHFVWGKKLCVLIDSTTLTFSFQTIKDYIIETILFIIVVVLFLYK